MGNENNRLELIIVQLNDGNMKQCIESGSREVQMVTKHSIHMQLLEEGGCSFVFKFNSIFKLNF